VEHPLASPRCALDACRIKYVAFADCHVQPGECPPVAAKPHQYAYVMATIEQGTYDVRTDYSRRPGHQSAHG
jgi:hypothetical protein